MTIQLLRNLSATAKANRSRHATNSPAWQACQYRIYDYSQRITAILKLRKS